MRTINFSHTFPPLTIEYIGDHIALFYRTLSKLAVVVGDFSDPQTWRHDAFTHRLITEPMFLDTTREKFRRVSYKTLAQIIPGLSRIKRWHGLPYEAEPFADDAPATLRYLFVSQVVNIENVWTLVTDTANWFTPIYLPGVRGGVGCFYFQDSRDSREQDKKERAQKYLHAVEHEELRYLAAPFPANNTLLHHRRLFFTMFCDGGEPGLRNHCLAVISPDSTYIRIVLGDSVNYIADFDINHDGTVMAVLNKPTRYSDGGLVTLYKLSRSGELAVKLATFDIPATNCRFSPDGLMLALLAESEVNPSLCRQIHLIDVE